MYLEMGILYPNKIYESMLFFVKFKRREKLRAPEEKWSSKWNLFVFKCSYSSFFQLFYDLLRSLKILWHFFFSLLRCWITLIDFWTLNQPSISVINLTWLCCIILFIHCCILFANFLKDFCIYVHERYWPIIFLMFSLTLVLFSSVLFNLQIYWDFSAIFVLLISS